MLIDFLKTATSKEDLATALRVLREFKAQESREEYLGIMFAAWAKLEQLEEFLAHLVEGRDLEPDTVAEIVRHSGATAPRPPVKPPSSSAAG